MEVDSKYFILTDKWKDNTFNFDPSLLSFAGGRKNEKNLVTVDYVLTRIHVDSTLDSGNYGLFRLKTRSFNNAVFPANFTEIKF